MISTVQRYDLLNLDQLAEQQEDLEKNKHHQVQRDGEEQDRFCAQDTNHEVVDYYSREQKLSPSEENHEVPTIQKKEPLPILSLPIKHHAPIIPSANVLMLDDFGFHDDEYYYEQETASNGANCREEVSAQIDNGNFPDHEVQEDQSFDFSSFWNSTDIFRDGILKIDGADYDADDTEKNVSGDSGLNEVGNNHDFEFSKRVLATFTTIPQPLNFFDDIEESINLDDDPILKKVAENKVNRALQAAQFFSVPPIDEAANKGTGSVKTSGNVRDLKQEASFLHALTNFFKFCLYQFSLIGHQFQKAYQTFKSTNSTPFDNLTEAGMVVWTILRVIMVIIVHSLLFFFQLCFKCLGFNIDVVSLFSFTSSISFSCFIILLP